MSAQVNATFDRCDADQGERAMVWLYRSGDDLTISLCGHHFRLEGLTLMALGFEKAEDRLSELEPRALAPVQ